MKLPFSILTIGHKGSGKSEMNTYTTEIVNKMICELQDSNEIKIENMINSTYSYWCEKIKQEPHRQIEYEKNMCDNFNFIKHISRKYE